MPSRSLRLAAAGLAQAGLLAAQQVPDVPANALIRVESHCRAPVGGVVEDCRADRSPRHDSGRFRSLDLDTLRLAVGDQGAPLAVPTPAVSRMWVAEGTRGHFAQGALIGLIAGGAIGALVGTQDVFCALDCGPDPAAGALMGAPVGLVLGGLVGLAIRSPRWREVDLAGWRASLAPAIGP